ncbi:uncharacterized protein LOC127094252 [Lathyrus oleraceus]|uniref:uncharacterized protein LOC127094252 n=1 Tax=Pisum sativum TaxID=3888 RepID=UPI0021D341ED|nr:uncharacterized protein LOC127094252 [Pisum sativum]
MEEYHHLLGIPVSDRIPFSGVEGILKSRVIAEAIHLRKSYIEANLTVKGGVKGLTSKFLIEKAFSFSNAGSMVAFETILALLIYGFVLTSKEGGTIVCCTPLLYKWFISHLAHSHIFIENKGCLRWSQRLMSLTNDDITFYSSVYENVEILDSCGEFSNVPLLDTQGGINYNPTIERRQVGFPTKDKPNKTLLEGIFFQEEKDTQGLKARMIYAWHNIHRKVKGELGLNNCIDLEPYTSWVKKRAREFKMPYAYERHIPLVMVKLPIIKGI